MYVCTHILIMYICVSTYIYTYICNLIYSSLSPLVPFPTTPFFPASPTLIFKTLFIYTPLHLTMFDCMNIGSGLFA